MSNRPIRESPEPLRARARPGPRSSLTLERIEQLSDLISGGNFIGTAARFAGISEATFHRWRVRGETEIDRLESNGVDLAAALGEDLTARVLWWRPAAGGDEWPYVVFAVVMDRSRAAGEVRAVHSIQTAASQGDWRAAAFFLERSYPARWGNRQRIAVETPEPLALQSVITVSELNEKLKALGVPAEPPSRPELPLLQLDEKIRNP